MKKSLTIFCVLIAVCFVVTTSANDSSHLIAANDGVGKAFGCTSMGTGCSP